MTDSKATWTRARDLSIPFSGQPGPWNAITDVPGVLVGFKTLIEDLPADDDGPVAVRTGVTAILPDSHARMQIPTWAGFSSFNGNGEMTGAHWVNEAGRFFGPILLTNTHSVGMVHHACLKWMTSRAEYNASSEPWLLPVVAETCDAYLNDINGFHVTVEHVHEAIESAVTGPVAEGNVGGGTGMRCYEYKGGTGTASRSLSVGTESYTLGALVQANFGKRKDLVIGDVPIGQHCLPSDNATGGSGSLIVVIATDAPLLPIQLQRIARRCALGMGRTGTPGYDSSGDLFIAFSTARAEVGDATRPHETMTFLNAEQIDLLFEATVQSSQEAIINAMVAAQSSTGHRGRSLEAIEHQWLASFFK
ncbi:MAG: P1 family peptidase [Gammaproteobacteria bacterium]|nr:P1 family peptidase [Gammaproteobacteria bacterium]